MPTFSAAQIERFKREAKELRRTSPLSHSEALDRIAGANGFPNWSLLMKHSDADDGPVASRSRRARPHHRFLRTPEQMRLALRKVPEPRGLFGPTRADSAQALVEDLAQSFASALNVVDFAIEYMTCLLAVPRLKIYSTTTVYWEMRSWLPYFFHEVEGDRQIVVNRRPNTRRSTICNCVCRATTSSASRRRGPRTDTCSTTAVHHGRLARMLRPIWRGCIFCAVCWCAEEPALK